MLLEFKVSNYKSIKDELTLSMLSDTPSVGITKNVCVDGKEKYIKPLIVCLGSNASGKSNIFKSLAELRNIIWDGSLVSWFYSAQ